MTARDPNADLIGYRFKSDEGELVVVGSAVWSPAYVICEGRTRTCRVASQLRQAKASRSR